jgi:large conductance mechanosensitive channel
MLKEFRNFAMKGNVLDLAIAVIIGASFGKIVSSFVNDVLMPPLGLLLGGLDFKEFAFVIQEATDEVPAITINYGHFLQMVVDFVIVAFCVFLLIKGINSFKKKEESIPSTPPGPSNEEKLLMEIRDLLKK